MKKQINKKVGDFLIVLIGDLGYKFIAEIIKKNPLRIKVQEFGDYHDLNEEEFKILEDETLLFQNRKTRSKLLQDQIDAKDPLISAINSMGVSDDEFVAIGPAEN